MHSLLQRQLKRYLDLESVNAAPPQWQEFLRAVSQAYQQSDADRRLLEHSLEMTSQEMQEGLAKIRAEVQERRQAQQELTIAYEGLERAQAQLFQAEKLAAVGQLASGIAHEVKNPLQIIVQGIDFLNQEVESKTPDVTDAVETIKDAVFRADRIVQGLLEFSRPSRLELRPVELRRLVEASLQLVEKQLTVRNISIRTEIPETLPRLFLDENQIKQVLINLILNAFQAMPDGGALSIRAFVTHLTEADIGVRRRAIDVLKTGERAVVCDLEDTGTGIPPEILRRLFEPFLTTKPPGQGTGLGLAITRSIIEHHQGLVSVSSIVGCGTTIRLFFPIREPS